MKRHPGASIFLIEAADVTVSTLLRRHQLPHHRPRKLGVDTFLSCSSGALLSGIIRGRWLSVSSIERGNRLASGRRLGLCSSPAWLYEEVIYQQRRTCMRILWAAGIVHFFAATAPSRPHLHPCSPRAAAAYFLLDEPAIMPKAIARRLALASAA